MRSASAVLACSFKNLVVVVFVLVGVVVVLLLLLLVRPGWVAGLVARARMKTVRHWFVHHCPPECNTGLGRRIGDATARWPVTVSDYPKQGKQDVQQHKLQKRELLYTFMISN